MRSIRGGSGLGDSLYVQSIARHLVIKGEELEICSSWDDVFRPLRPRVEVVMYRRTPVDIVAHYMQRRDLPTDQFEDVCISARLPPEDVEMKIDWQIVGCEHLKKIAPKGKPVIAVQLPRNPLGKEGNATLGADLLPNVEFMQRAVDRLKGRAWLMQIGRGTPRWYFRGLDLDLANRTSIAELLDVSSLADGFFGYCSFMVPLAESFQKPALFAWSRRGLDSRDSYTRRVRPQKILHSPSSRHVIDNASDAELERAIDEFLDAIRNPAGVQWEASGDRGERAGLAG